MKQGLKFLTLFFGLALVVSDCSALLTEKQKAAMWHGLSPNLTRVMDAGQRSSTTDFSGQASAPFSNLTIHGLTMPNSQFKVDDYIKKIMSGVQDQDTIETINSARQRQIAMAGILKDKIIPILLVLLNAWYARLNDPKVKDSYSEETRPYTRARDNEELQVVRGPLWVFEDAREAYYAAELQLVKKIMDTKKSADIEKWYDSVSKAFASARAALTSAEARLTDEQRVFYADQQTGNRTTKLKRRVQRLEQRFPITNEKRGTMSATQKPLTRKDLDDALKRLNNTRVEKKHQYGSNTTTRTKVIPAPAGTTRRRSDGATAKKSVRERTPTRYPRARSVAST